jgi:hypothetical protein
LVISDIAFNISLTYTYLYIIRMLSCTPGPVKTGMLEEWEIGMMEGWMNGF